MNITQPIRDRARIEPGRTAAVRLDGSTLSYQALDHAIDATAARLLAAGWQPGQIAGLDIAGPDELASLVAALALARIGLASAAPAHGAPPLDPASLLGPPPGPAPAIAPDPGLMRIFTSSGTTGRPKSIPLTHATQAARIQAVWHAYGDGPETALVAIGLGSSAGFSTALATLWAGGALLFTRADRAHEALRRTGTASILAAPNTLANLLATIPPGAPPLPALRIVRATGSVVSPRLAHALRTRLCPNLLSHYGSTEAGLIAHGPIDGTDPTIAGRLAHGVRAEALGPAGHPLPSGQPGELRIRTPTHAGPYLGPAPSLFRDGWFHGGDIGTVEHDGTIRLLGRADEVINAGGHKFLPSLVETALIRIEGVSEAACFGVLDPQGRVQVWAAVVGPHPLPKPLLQAGCTGLGAATPTMIVQLPSLPRTPTGKLARLDLSHEAAAHLRRAP